MPLKTDPLEEPAINLTSMLDVVMLLIVFFMVGTKFSEEERQTKIQVPTIADTAAASGQPDEIVINVTREGQITVRSESHTPETLQLMLEKARQNFPGQGVVIRGDGRGSLQMVADVMSAVKAAGIKSMSLACVPNAKGT